ncbi:DegT/DnrJ/EryC1/StrS family aminotransferase [Bacteroides sp. AM10-21B]|uniref:DegT/DnrJ/EryC1/StrS family aminotransferase n=1 Tax=Bacteroides sp. AM10-21B TaxID=2292001 RepID=UPI000E4E5468|nr:DegT/DnrJ/EryC1/StrS family aminotransferase [Bacteroides sp. AM10-21B]RHJ47618.1 DegT/DnrJ/EryC1/StrS aminotransferase family protein [Bacteroides sp. AM10-21B]
MAIGNLYSGYVINPTWELTPRIFISPFSSSEISALDENLYIKISTGKSYLDESFGNYCLAPKGRLAIEKVLSNYHLENNDVVTILTTSANFYISSCVTSVIERFCKWSRKIEKNTKLVFVNHEFGYPYKGLKAVADLGFPIVEDCAHTFFSDGSKAEIGKYSDFVIYSFPKALPMQLGAAITSNRFPLEADANEMYAKYIFSKLSDLIPKIEDIKEKRLCVYKRFEEGLRPLGIRPYFELEDGVIPGVFLFKWNDHINYPKLKEFMQSNGIESSVFYGQHAFYIPCHQNLSYDQCGYIMALLKYFSEYYND